jgi:hypothetical protein
MYLIKKKSKSSVDWIRLVYCLAVVNVAMIMHGSYEAGNSERQAAPERGAWPMEMHFFFCTMILVYCRSAEILGA